MINKLNLLLKKNWPLLLLTGFFSLFYLKYISLVTADLGRHLMNGKHILAGNFDILSRNFYSYTYPNFPFPNHHWLFGVIARVIEQIGGFTGLSIFNLILYSMAFFLVVKLAQIKTSNSFAIIAGLIALPLITYRTEVRPETISIFLLSLYIFIFSLLTGKTFNKVTRIKKYFIVTILLLSQLIWTNAHLFFIFGPFISLVFLFSEIVSNYLEHKKVVSKKIKFLFIITSLLFLVTIINPHGINGSLAPFKIFNKYGYRVAENQSTLFMIKIKHRVAQHSYSISIAVLALLSFNTFKIKKLTKPKAELISSLIFFLTFALLAQKINRVSSFFGIILIPILAQNLYLIFKNNEKRLKKLFNNDIFLMTSSPLLIGLVIFLISKGLLLPNFNQFGLANVPNMESSVRFFNEAEIKGNIYNNYDIGGYLTYYLPEDRKLFVDNRPESYPQEFFEDEYIAAQKDEDSWIRVSEKYDIRSIYFFRLDQTDSAQPFLHRRVLDPEWIPVFVDNYTLIFVKDTEDNKAVIEEFRIPNEVFGMTKIE